MLEMSSENTRRRAARSLAAWHRPQSCLRDSPSSPPDSSNLIASSRTPNERFANTHFFSDHAPH